MVGVFDSGAGGLSVWKELVRLMPDMEFAYFSDSGHCPYGPKPPSQIIERAKFITDFLLDKGASAIVVACNTATAAAISYLRENYTVPFVGMEPAIKPAALHSKSGVVGVLATAGTLKGELYLRTSNTFAGNVKIVERVGEGLVEAVERGDFGSEEVISLLHKFIDPMLEAGADHIVLGCTHYPFLTEAIASITAGRAEIVNPAPAVARQVMKVIGYQPSNSIGNTRFYTTGDIEKLRFLARTINPALPDLSFSC